MIFNRTMEDVRNAIGIRENYVQKGIALTEEQIAVMEKGMLTINALNRIENKQSELYNRAVERGYDCETIITRTWDDNDVFAKFDFKRICENLNALEKAFFFPKTTIELKYEYRQINAIE